MVLQENGLLKAVSFDARKDLWRGFTTLGADGAYVGETGIALDSWLATQTTLCCRVGFHDYLHLYDSVGRNLLQHRKPAKRDSPPQAEASPGASQDANAATSSSDSSSTSSESEPLETTGVAAAVPETIEAPHGLQAWLRLLRQQKRLFKMGAARRILNKELVQYGFTRKSGVQACGALKYIVYCSNYLKQSFRHFAVPGAAA